VARMAMSRQIPDATAFVDCDATRLWRLRRRLVEVHPDAHVTTFAIILRACVAALHEFPSLNSTLDTERGEVVLHRHVNLGFAAATERGLLVPVIKDAHLMSTVRIAAELHRLTTAARAGTAKPGELTGGTFTVSNYGALGVDGGIPIINFPEAALLGVGRITDRPWVHNGAIKPRKVAQLSVVFDHRVVDGAEAAGFLRLLADCIEHPSRLLAVL
jgi:2-oxoisovalerate dehydrogenase E2 component (dihydrolipoyl transacylase)